MSEMIAYLIGLGSGWGLAYLWYHGKYTANITLTYSTQKDLRTDLEKVKKILNSKKDW